MDLDLGPHEFSILDGTETLNLLESFPLCHDVCGCDMIMMLNLDKSDKARKIMENSIRLVT